MDARELEVEELAAREEDDAGSDPDGGEDLGVNGNNEDVPGSAGEGDKPHHWWPRCPRLRTVWRRYAACFDLDKKGVTYW